MEDDTMGTEDDYKQAKAIYDQEIKDSASFTLNEKESIQAEVDRLGEKAHWERMARMEGRECSGSNPISRLRGLSILTLPGMTSPLPG